MPAHMSYTGITVTAALGSVLFGQYRRDTDHGPAQDRLASLSASFALLWAGAFGMCCLYFAFIYPFYVSPLRHLPTPDGAHWLLGHLSQLLVASPGVPLRKWYAA